MAILTLFQVVFHLLQVFFFHFTTLHISIFSPVVGCLQDPFLRTNNRGCPLPTSNRQSKWLSLMILATSSTKSVSFLIRTSGKYYTQADLTIRPTPTVFNTSFAKYVEYSYITAGAEPLLVDSFEILGWPGRGGRWTSLDASFARCFAIFWNIVKTSQR